MTLDPVLTFCIAWFLAALLAQAGLHKLLQRREFLVALEGYDLLPKAALQPATLGLGGLELALAAALIVPGAMPLVAWAAAALFTLYALAIALAVARGRTGFDCGCEWGRQSKSTIGWGAILRAAFLAVLALACTVPLSRSAGLFEIANGALGGLAVSVLVHSLHFVRANSMQIAAIRSKGAVS